MQIVRRRFYCLNLAGCEFARRDHVYDAAAFRQNPHCHGTRADGCGQPLVEGRAIDRRLPILLAIAGAVGLLWVGHRALFPPPLEGIAFEAANTRIVTSDAPTQIAIVRRGDASAAAGVLFRTEDGSAHAGADYLADGERVQFAAGERRAMLRLKALAIPTPSSNVEKNFRIVLSNVRGTPSHPVVIGPPPPTPESLTQAQTMVRAVSSLALEVGVLYVKIQVAQSVIGSNAASADERQHYARRLQSLISNSEQARQRYVVLAGDLCALDPRSVAQSFQDWIERLNRSNVPQQRDATSIAQKLNGRYCENKIVDIDSWARQLSAAIPRAVSPATRT